MSSTDEPKVFDGKTQHSYLGELAGKALVTLEGHEVQATLVLCGKGRTAVASHKVFSTGLINGMLVDGLARTIRMVEVRTPDIGEAMVDDVVRLLRWRMQRIRRGIGD